MRLLPTREQISKALHEKNAVHRAFARRTFRIWEALGFHVTANHFHEPVPSTKAVLSNYTDGPRPCPRLDFRADACREACLEMMSSVRTALRPALERAGYRQGNGYFSVVDSVCLFGMLRRHKPARVIEVGRGSSTLVAGAAMLVNQAEGHPQQFVSIDPFPRLDGTESFDGLDVDIRIGSLENSTDFILQTIRPGDLRFIDSSHVFKYGSDVFILFARVLPLLPVGSFMHVHDVFSPFDYPRDWLVQQRRFWNEQYTLENFLRFNSAFRVELPVQHLFRSSEPIRQAYREYFP